MDKKVEKNQSEVGGRMKTLRLKQGMTQSELAKEFSYTSQNISQIENGRINPSVDVLKVYSEYFHVSIDFLLNGENFHSELKASGSQNISQIENGRINPSVDVLKVYSEYFHVSIDFLLNGENFHSELKASGIEGDLDVIQKTVTHIKEKLRSKDCLQNERSAC